MEEGEAIVVNVKKKSKKRRKSDAAAEIEEVGDDNVVDNEDPSERDKRKERHKEKKKKKKEMRREYKNEVVTEERTEDRNKHQILSENHDRNATMKIKKKRNRDSKNDSTKHKKQDNEIETEKVAEMFSDGKVSKKTERRKRKKEKVDMKGDFGAVEQDIGVEGSLESEGGQAHNDNIGKSEKTKSIDSAQEPKPRGSNKKVRFSGQVEVFPSLDVPEAEELETEEKKLVRGKRFSREEDEIVMDAVHKYIESHDLGEDGLDMVLNCKAHSKTRNCWKEIGSAIPYRPYKAIYYRAQVLFRRGEKRRWTEEEYELIRKFQEQHGNQWKVLAEELGKHRFHVKDTWRRIKLSNEKKGHWSQEEYQTLFDLVNVNLRLKVFEEKKSKHGMLRDNICWTAISDKLSTRTNANCCRKWYHQLTSPLVAEGKWDDADDYRLLNALFDLDASCIEDVDWDNLLDHRAGDICRKRWNQMVLHIGNHGNKSFAEQVEVLSKRYCLDLLEARETWDGKPVTE